MVFLPLVSGAQSGTIELSKDNLGNSFGDQVLVLEDPEHVFSLEDILYNDSLAFKSLPDKIPNLDFTTSRWWLKFHIQNKTASPNFILEIARPITNKVAFYEVRGEITENAFVSGDDQDFSKKVIPHRKNLFPLYIEQGQTKTYVVELESDGEVITFPVKIYDKISFFETDYLFQFTYGFYFGMMLLVVFIYFFFFILLRDRSFLFYIIYVFCQACMQFSLDGYAYQYLFP